MLNNQKKLLVAGGGYADIPLIQAAKALGFYVITSGNRPEELGHQYSDEYRLEDFADKQAMLKLAENLNIDAICAACNDFSALTAAYVAEKLQLPGHDPYEVALVIHHKDKFRQFTRENSIPSPYAAAFTSVEDAMRNLNSFKLPVIVKPVDLTGGKGISKITTMEMAKAQLQAAFDISWAKRVVVEEFIEGTRHGLSTFIQDGRVVFYFHDNEHYYKNPYMVAAASTPANVPPVVITSLCQTAEKIVGLLQLKTGIFHIQYILSEDLPVIIEICRRAPGDLYIKFVQHATGIDYPSFIVRAVAGMSCDTLRAVQPQGYFTRHCVMPPHNGKIRDLVIDESIRANIIDKFMWWEPDHNVDYFLTHKLGIVFLQFASMAEMLNSSENMPKLIRVEMDNTSG